VLAVLACLGCERERLVALEATLAPAAAALDKVHRTEASDVVDAPPTARRDLPAAPTGYVLMTPVARSTDYGDAVLLRHPTEEVFVPIYIGGTEALSIQLRLEKRRFKRPLTHDLLDAFAAKLGAKLLRAQVDSLEETAFIGSVVFDKGGEIIVFDARPSDAIALAIGNDAPIYVSEKVLADAGIRPEDIAEQAERGAEPVAL
jgi:uncharacterized protein